jgi:hypothetical protein
VLLITNQAHPYMPYSGLTHYIVRNLTLKHDTKILHNEKDPYEIPNETLLPDPTICRLPNPRLPNDRLLK